MLIVDTGPLLAAADSADPDHGACVTLLTESSEPLHTTPLVVAEAAYLIGRRISPEAEARFFRSISSGDASLIALAERLDQSTIATLDRRHFSVVRPAHVAGFEIVPKP